MFEPAVTQISGAQADICIRHNNRAIADVRRHGVRGGVMARAVASYALAMIAFMFLLGVVFEPLWR